MSERDSIVLPGGESRHMCRRCVLPESPPDVVLDDEGICVHCRAAERTRNNVMDRPLLESDLVKLLKKYKGKGRYDCLVMCSGGKDSTSALYYMKTRYGMNPLAFTFDHGFESEEAMSNITHAVDILGVDLVYHRTAYMQEMFSRILCTGSKAVLCHPCSIWYIGLAYETAKRYKIPLIVAGWTKGQSTTEMRGKAGCESGAPEFHSMAAETRAFMEKDVSCMAAYKGFPGTMNEAIKMARKLHRAIVISPHWFLPYSTEEYTETLMTELKWKAPTLSYPAGSTNCMLNYISVYNSLKHYGYTHYHVEMSKLIRQGLMTREEAWDKLHIEFDMEFLNSIAQKLDYEFTER